MSVVRCACFEKKAQQNKNLDSVLFAFLENSTILKEAILI